MKLSGNTMLITGGGSGIGLGLAQEFLKRDNTVIIAGRDMQRLQRAAEENPELKTLQGDVSTPEGAQQLAREAVSRFPALNILVNNAGMMQRENLMNLDSLSNGAEETVQINLLGLMRLTSALLPSLSSKPYGAVVNVTSGLAFVPSAYFPTYCATKAAVHSYTQSLRYQLRDTPIDVVEIAPPYVQTELTGAHQATDPNAMPLSAYLNETMRLLEEQPDAAEILVEGVCARRYAEQGGQEAYARFFKEFNDRMVIERQ